MSQSLGETPQLHQGVLRVKLRCRFFVQTFSDSSDLHIVIKCKHCGLVYLLVSKLLNKPFARIRVSCFVTLQWITSLFFSSYYVKADDCFFSCLGMKFKHAWNNKKHCVNRFDSAAKRLHKPRNKRRRLNL